MKSNSIVGNKAYEFALNIIETYKELSIEKKEYILSKQILKSGTSIGANIQEGLAAESKKDFIHKLGISLKEARETLYWLNLLKDSHYIEETNFSILESKCIEIIKLLNSIIISSKKSLEKQK